MAPTIEELTPAQGITALQERLAHVTKNRDDLAVANGELAQDLLHLRDVLRRVTNHFVAAIQIVHAETCDGSGDSDPAGCPEDCGDEMELVQEARSALARAALAAPPPVATKEPLADVLSMVLKGLEDEIASSGQVPFTSDEMDRIRAAVGTATPSPGDAAPPCPPGCKGWYCNHAAETVNGLIRERDEAIERRDRAVAAQQEIAAERDEAAARMHAAHARNIDLEFERDQAKAELAEANTVLVDTGKARDAATARMLLLHDLLERCMPAMTAVQHRYGNWRQWLDDARATLQLAPAQAEEPKCKCRPVTGDVGCVFDEWHGAACEFCPCDCHGSPPGRGPKGGQ